MHAIHAMRATHPDVSSAEDITLLTEDSEVRRIAVLRFWLRRATHRMVADCERLLDTLRAPQREDWRDAIGEALLASHHILALVNGLEDAQLSQHVSLVVASVTAAIEEPRRRIVDSLTPLLHVVAVGAEDELILGDVRAVRDAAADLFSGGRQSAVRDQHPRDQITAPRKPALHADAPRVLIVDDEKLLRVILQRQLARLGYETVLAEDGKSAYEIAQREPLDLILTDINMPKLNGIQLLGLLKGNERTRHVPVIVISSEDGLSSVARCIELGAEDHIAKPYEPRLLEARTRASLERKRMRDVELDYLRRVSVLTAAAEAVEADLYVPGSLGDAAQGADPLAGLARVFDRMVTGFKSREERLQLRLRHLRSEMGGALSGSDAAHVTADSPYASGEVVAMRYEVRGRIGKGGMGLVYHATDRELGEDVALKVIRADLVARDPTMIERLKSEIRLARRISHRNVVRVHDIGEWIGTHYITMELVKGITLAELIDRRGRLGVDATLAIGTQVAEALAVAHDEQIVHRDIKPANLFVDEAGVLKVMDFGIARLIERDASLTAGGFIIGTPQYMAPEQLMGAAVDARGDLFSVGVVLYECLTGRPPYVAESPIALVSLMMEANYPPLAQAGVVAPPRLERIIQQLLQVQPGARVQSARALSAMLAEVEHDHGQGSS